MTRQPPRFPLSLILSLIAACNSSPGGSTSLLAKLLLAKLLLAKLLLDDLLLADRIDVAGVLVLPL